MFEIIVIVHRSNQPISHNHNFSTNWTKIMIARSWLVRTVYYNSDFKISEKDWMARNVYYPDDFEAHKNLSHKQFPISVYYLMDGAVHL